MKPACGSCGAILSCHFLRRYARFDAVFVALCAIYKIWSRYGLRAILRVKSGNRQSRATRAIICS